MYQPTNGSSKARELQGLSSAGERLANSNTFQGRYREPNLPALQVSPQKELYWRQNGYWVIG